MVVITTSSKVEAQGELEIVHLNVLAPVPSTVSPEVGEVGVVIVPAPAINVHKPVPGAGAFPAKVAVVTPQAGFWSGPAAAAGAAAVTLTEAVLAFTQPQVLHACKV